MLGKTVNPTLSSFFSAMSTESHTAGPILLDSSALSTISVAQWKIVTTACSRRRPE